MGLESTATTHKINDHFASYTKTGMTLSKKNSVSIGDLRQ